jgi:ATP-binding cassette subfamily F protein 3
MLQITDLDFTAWGRPFFEGANLLVPQGTKVGLVGRNGVGKSTLFKLIKGEYVPNGGTVTLPRGARLGAVDQEHPATAVSLIDTVLEADVERRDLLAALDAAPPERLGEIYAAADLGRPMADFSGGWRMRVALAAALFAEPDLLLLDEPTNYLDLEGALWLETRLKKYPHAALIISHDRELLNNAVDAIAHVSEGKLDLYAGGYDDFERRRGEKARHAAAARSKQEAERAHLQSFVDRFRAKASKAAQAQSRLKRLAKLQPVELLMEDRAQRFLIPSPERPLAPPLIRLEGASVGYGEVEILRRLSLRIDVEDRIGLLGVNGAGKSTFAKLLAGALKAKSGSVQRDRRLEVGWFHQHQIEALDAEDTPLDIIRQALPDSPEAQRRSRLAQFGFTSEKQATKVRDLSGGERARLLLNLVAMRRPHLLILDEPTNHLDIDSRRLLLDALNDYAGAVLLITHDRSLMELVADRLWLASDGMIEPFAGDMDDYARLVVERARKAARAPQPTAPPEAPAPEPAAVAAPAAPRASPSTLRRKAEASEARLHAAGAALSALDADLAVAAAAPGGAGRLAELARARKRAEAELQAAEADWLAAAEALEHAVRA